MIERSWGKFPGWLGELSALQIKRAWEVEGGEQGWHARSTAPRASRSGSVASKPSKRKRGESAR